MLRHRRWTVCVAAFVAVSACTAAPKPTESVAATSATSLTPTATPTPTPTTPTTSPTAAPSETPTPVVSASGSVEQQLKQAYVNYAHALEKSFATNDTNSPELRATTTGPLLTNLIEVMIQSKVKNRVLKGKLPTNATVKSLAADRKTAVMSICDDGSTVSFYNSKTGKKIVTPPELAITDTTFVLKDGVWKATKSEIFGAATC